MNIEIRTATEYDTEQTAALFDAYRQFYQQPPDLAAARRFIHDRIQNNDSIILVATTTKRDVIGFCQLYPTFCSVLAKPIYVLYDLFVTPPARNSGAGRALLTRAGELAEQNGIARIDLSTARTNQSAQKLYESMGWVRDNVFCVYNLTIRAG
jgi:ribosomal protein S18 acetylase RimI-like enzyme